MTSNRIEQAKLLDLLEVFREYTEKGYIRYTASILGSQIANLEQTSRKLEKQTKINYTTSTSTSIPSKPTSWATIASQPNPSSEPQWTIVSNKNQGNRTRASGTKSPSPSPKELAELKARKGKEALTRRCTLLQERNAQANTSFSSIKIRNSLNDAFKKKGIQGLVISTVTLSIRGNIVVNTTPDFNSDFLIQNKDIIKGVLPLVTSLKKGEP